MDLSRLELFFKKKNFVPSINEQWRRINWGEGGGDNPNKPANSKIGQFYPWQIFSTEVPKLWFFKVAKGYSLACFSSFPLPLLTYFTTENENFWRWLLFCFPTLISNLFWPKTSQRWAILYRTVQSYGELAKVHPNRWQLAHLDPKSSRKWAKFAYKIYKIEEE